MSDDATAQITRLTAPDGRAPTLAEFIAYGLSRFGRRDIRAALGGGSVVTNVKDAMEAVDRHYEHLDEADCDVPTGALDDVADALGKALKILGATPG